MRCCRVLRENPWCRYCSSEPSAYAWDSSAATRSAGGAGGGGGGVVGRGGCAMEGKRVRNCWSGGPFLHHSSCDACWHRRLYEMLLVP